MSRAFDAEWRHFLATTLLTLASVELVIGSATAASETKSLTLPVIEPGTNTTFPPLKHIDAGVLSVAYAEVGPVDGRPAILLHGWP